MKKAHIRGALVGVEAVTAEGLKAVYKDFNLSGDNLVKQGWTGASSTIGSRTNAGSTDVATTVVYYADAANEPAARAMLLSLKVGSIRLSTAYPGSPITVVLGRDYVLPAG